MFKKNINLEPAWIDEEIQSVIHQMQSFVADSPEYNTMFDKLERLYQMKLKDKPEKKSVSPDALIAAGASIGGVILILGFEKANVLTSKAIGFIVKPKL